MQNKINRISFVIDRSGSMQGVMPSAIRAFNENLIAIKKQVEETKQSATVSLYVFNNAVETLFFNRPIDDCKPLSENDVRTGGQTALFEASALAINDLKNLKVGSDEDVSYLINVITDGEENASRPSTPIATSNLLKLMQEVQRTDMWTMTFLVPRGSKSRLCRSFNLSEGNVLEWDTTAAGVQAYGAANNAGITRYFSARAAGQKSVKSFYTDLSHVSVSDVRQLTNLSDKAKILYVTSDTDIKTFIEDSGLAFISGAAFYQLVGGKDRPDKVQDYKKVLIMERNKSHVYGGDDARHLIGLTNSEVSVRPGNQGNFDIFIQSTSTNRKLKAGTKVIYMPSAVI